jgi:hypothetical protein
MLSSEEIEIIKRFRDLPYYIALNRDNFDNDLPQEISQHQGASCLQRYIYQTTDIAPNHCWIMSLNTNYIRWSAPMPILEAIRYIELLAFI